MLVDRNHDTLHRQVHFLCRSFNDADVGLMGNQPVDFGRRHLSSIAALLRHIGKNANRKFENSLTIHAQERVANDLTTADIAWNGKNAVMGAVGVQCCCENARPLGSFKHNSPRAITKQDACGTIVPVQNA